MQVEYFEAVLPIRIVLNVRLNIFTMEYFTFLENLSREKYYGRYNYSKQFLSAAALWRKFVIKLP